MLLDLRDEIEHHCMSCLDIETERCDSCFFASVDFGKRNLGSNAMYRKAFLYLKKMTLVGYKKAFVFGERLRIPMKVSL